MRKKLAIASAGTVLLVTGCSQDSAESTGGNDEPLQVFAAASLTDTFTEIGELFEQEHGIPVTFNFAGSSDLVAQIEQGAPADVFASADEANMDRADDAGVLGEEPVVFASNTLMIVTPPGNPSEVANLADLAGDDVVTVICAPQVPCGAATEQVADAAGVQLSPASEESAVTDVLGKVRAGEADAGLVYQTDAIGAGDDVEAIAFDEAEDVVNLYPVAPLESSGQADNAAAFVEFITGTESQTILEDAGFGQP